MLLIPPMNHETSQKCSEKAILCLESNIAANGARMAIMSTRSVL